MNAVVTQALPHWAEAWGTAILIFGGGWVIISFLFMASTNDSEHWGMRGWLGWGASSAVVVALGVGFFVLPDKQDVVEYSDAKSYVASETGQELESKYSDGPFGSSSPSLSIDRDGECMKDMSCHQWYVKVHDTKWYFKDADGKPVFWEPVSGQQFSVSDMKTVKVDDVRQKVIKGSNLKNPSVQFAEKGPVLVGEAKSAGSEKIKVVGEYEGRLVEAYAGVNDKGDVNLVPMGVSSDVSADDLMKK